MAVMGLVALPGTMIGQILGGSTPDVAIKYQMMIIVITISSSMVSIAVTLNMIKRVAFDAAGRIKNVSKESSREKR
jgi:putative ABC transport system permease protein